MHPSQTFPSPMSVITWLPTILHPERSLDLSFPASPTHPPLTEKRRSDTFVSTVRITPTRRTRRMLVNSLRTDLPRSSSDARGFGTEKLPMAIASEEDRDHPPPYSGASRISPLPPSTNSPRDKCCSKARKKKKHGVVPPPPPDLRL